MPDPTLLPLRNVHLIGPFENAGYQGLETVYPPEQEIDLTAVYRGKAEEVSWRHAPGLEGVLEHPIDLGAWLPTENWSVLYVYAEVEVETPQIAELLTGSPAMVWAWANGQLALSPTIPHPANLQDDCVFIALRPGINTLLLKLHFGGEPWSLEWRCESYGAPKRSRRRSRIWSTARRMI